MENIKLLSHILEMNRGHYVSSGDYSVTGIIQPPRITALQKRYSSVAKPSFKSQIAAFIGTAIHDRAEAMLRLANAKYKNIYQLERRIVIPYTLWPDDPEKLQDKIDYRLISGKYDVLLSDKHLYDIKTANVWKIVFDPDLKEWHEQQNLYDWLLKQRGVNVDTLNIVCFYKDWKQGEALRNKSMPQNQVVEYKLDKWTTQQQEDFLIDRMEMHIAQEETPDDELPACTREDRWERFPDGSTVQYALLKIRKAKRATRVLPTLDEALSYARQAKGFGNDSWIEIRYAQRKRCEDYCGINAYCNHYEAYCAKMDTGSLNEYISLKDKL